MHCVVNYNGVVCRCTEVVCATSSPSKTARPIQSKRTTMAFHEDHDTRSCLDAANAGTHRHTGIHVLKTCSNNIVGMYINVCNYAYMCAYVRACVRTRVCRHTRACVHACCKMQQWTAPNYRLRHSVTL